MKYFSSLLIALFFISFAAGPAIAESGSSGKGKTQSSSSATIMTLGGNRLTEMERPEVSPTPKTESNREDEMENETEMHHEMGATIATKAASLKLRAEDAKQVVSERLAAKKLESCQKRQSNIVRQMSKTQTVAQNLVSKFDAIAQKALDFQSSKKITVSNLDALKATVADKKAAANTAISALSDHPTFTCTSEGPKKQLQEFVTQTDTVRKALKDYKQAVHDLIQGIKQANGENRENQSTSSAQEAN